MKHGPMGPGPAVGVMAAGRPGTGGLSPAPPVGRRAFAFGSLTVVGAVLGGSLGGCGFQPIYMPTASGKAGVAQRELASVYVPVIPERPGQLLRQALQERFGSDSGTQAAYNLNVTFGVAGEGIGINTDNIATRIRLTGTATYTLVANDPKRTSLTSGSARAIDGVNIFDSQYFAADLELEAEQKRIAENLATQIANQLGIWFRQRAAKQTG
jgi:LPS-assembly lipoprotein